MTDVTVFSTTLNILKALVQVGVPLFGFCVALKAPSRRTSPIWRSLTLFFGLTLAAAVGRQLMSLIGAPVLMQYMREAALPPTQSGMILSVASLPFTFVSLAAWIVLFLLVVRENPRKRQA